MTIWIPNLSRKKGPRYLAIVNAIEEAIESGELKHGNRLLPQREFAYQIGLTLGTVSRAFTLAQKRGLIKGEVGRGSFVCSKDFNPESLDFMRQNRNEALDLACFLPPGNAIADSITAILADMGREGLQSSLHRYMPGQGITRHRTAGAKWIARFGYDVSPDDVVVTPGAQHGLTAIFSTLGSPGETVLTEALTYSGVKQLSNLFHMRTEGIAVDDQGIIPDALSDACKASSAKILYVQPTVHNPTTAIMGSKRRDAIAEIAREFDLTVIEDASCAAFADTACTPLTARIPERCFLVTGTSKSLSPSLRVGFVCCPQDLWQRFVANLHTFSLSAPSLTAEVTARLVTSDGIDTLMLSLASELTARHDVISRKLGQYQTAHHGASPYAWLTLPNGWRASEFCAAAYLNGVSVVSADNFAVGRINAPQSIRISVGIDPSHGSFEQGIAKLANILSKPTLVQDAVI